MADNALYLELAQEREQGIRALARTIQGNANALSKGSLDRAKEIYAQADRISSLPRNLTPSELQKCAYDLSGEQNFDEWVEKFTVTTASCQSDAARIKALEIAHSGEKYKVIYNVLKEKNVGTRLY